MSLSNHISLKYVPLKSLSVFFGLLTGWFALSLVMPLYVVDWIVSQPEMADVRVEMAIMMTWCIAVSTTMSLYRLLRNEWVVKHCNWADGYMETITYPLRGDEST